MLAYTFYVLGLDFNHTMYKYTNIALLWLYIACEQIHIHIHVHVLLQVSCINTITCTYTYMFGLKHPLHLTVFGWKHPLHLIEISDSQYPLPSFGKYIAVVECISNKNCSVH